MTEVFSESFIPLSPRNFFAFEQELYAVDWEPVKANRKHPLEAKKYSFPLTTGLAGEESFADFAMGWSTEGLVILVTYHSGFERSIFPDIHRGDAVELFIDTRDVKTAGFPTRFCHHFFFLAESVNGVHAGERTQFRTEDRHELCEATDLGVKRFGKKRLELRVPGHCLTGYDPIDFARLGFSYRLSRFGGSPQHFSVSSSEYSVDQQPSLWTTLRLTS